MLLVFAETILKIVRYMQNEVERRWTVTEMNRKMRRQGKPQGVSYADDIGPKRFKLFLEKLQEVTDWYQEMLDNTDEVYANEKLRWEACKVSGTDIEPLYDAEMYEAMKKWNEANGK